MAAADLVLQQLYHTEHTYLSAAWSYIRTFPSPILSNTQSHLTNATQLTQAALTSILFPSMDPTTTMSQIHNTLIRVDRRMEVSIETNTSVAERNTIPRFPVSYGLSLWPPGTIPCALVCLLILIILYALYLALRKRTWSRNHASIPRGQRRATFWEYSRHLELRIDRKRPPWARRIHDAEAEDPTRCPAEATSLGGRDSGLGTICHGHGNGNGAGNSTNGDTCITIRRPVGLLAAPMGDFDTHSISNTPSTPRIPKPQDTVQPASPQPSEKTHKIRDLWANAKATAKDLVNPLSACFRRRNRDRDRDRGRMTQSVLK